MMLNGSRDPTHGTFAVPESAIHVLDAGAIVPRTLQLRVGSIA